MRKTRFIENCRCYHQISTYFNCYYLSPLLEKGIIVLLIWWYINFSKTLKIKSRIDDDE